jgi:MFS transporter, UMF1 family
MSTIAAPLPANTYQRRSLAWAIYDWANSSVVTLVIAAVFPLFYNNIARTEIGVNAASAYSFSITIGLLLSAFIGPVLGTYSDLAGTRKRLLVIFTALGSLAVIAMFGLRIAPCLEVSAADPDTCSVFSPTNNWVVASLLFILVQIFLNTSLGLYNALLPHVAEPADQNRVSALGYGLGYIGGGLLLAGCLFMILSPARFGLDGTETATRISLAVSGIWWLIFSFPLFATVPEPPPTPIKDMQGSVVAGTFRQLAGTFKKIRGYRHLFLMLLAFWLYSDGIGTIIQLATTYGQQQIGLDQGTLIGALLVTQFVAFPFALLYGQIPNPESKHRDFYVAFIVWTTVSFPLLGVYAAANNVGTGTVFTLIGISQVIGLIASWLVGKRLVTPLTSRLNTKWAIILGLGVYCIISIWGFFLYTAAEFWMLAWLVGTVQGGTQALSRSLYSSLSPRSKSGEFFGFYGFSDKFAGILGPLIFGVIGAATGGNLRFSILSVIIFFVAGAALLAFVNVEEGQKHAQEEDERVGYKEDLDTVTP